MQKTAIALVTSLALLACGDASSTDTGSSQPSDGAGGKSAASGGKASTGAGGSTASGGMTAAGGSSSGGSVAAGGAASAGMTAAGGAEATGGMVATGGMAAVAGMTAAGGMATAGMTGAGGMMAMAGMTGAAGMTPSGEPRLAEGVEVSEVALLQAVKVPLMQGGAEVVPRNAPVVEGREARVRVYVTPLSGFTPRSLRAELVLSAGGPAIALSDEQVVGGPSSDSDPATLFEIDVDASMVQASTAYAVRVVDAAAPPVVGGASHPARYPRDGSTALLKPSSPGGALRVVLVPMRYDADGSGRLPDTGPEQLDVYRSLLRAVYPVVEVDLSVHEPVPWSTGLSLTGNVKFGTLNGVLEELRVTDGAADDVYYYALVKPTDTFDEYCGWSCVTGQSYVVEDPTDASIRVGSGLGFGGEDSGWTLVHELGHMHGRSHAPCDAGDVDPDFPYADGLIGVLGYDSRTKQQLDPTETYDIMGYCDPTWVSDYTYSAWFSRIQLLNGAGPLYVGAPAKAAARVVRLLDEQPSGELAWGPQVSVRPSKGQVLPGRYVDAVGNGLGQVEAVRTPLSHGGARWQVPAPPAGARALEVAGVTVVIEG